MSGRAKADHSLTELLTAAAPVEVAALVLAGAPRSTVDAQLVAELAADAHPGVPIIVHSPTNRVVDGVHRVRAAIRRGETRIDARAFPGDESELMTLAVAANAAHGRPISTDDRKAAAHRLLAEHPNWSTRRIAVAACLAPGTVGRMRGDASPTEVRIGRNGRMRAVDTRPGRKIACALLTAEPGISLRQAALRAGISPSTVRDVRAHMLDHVEPPPAESAPSGAVLAQLRTDPSLRSTITGRLLLARLTASTWGAEDVVRLAGALPPHCTELVAAAAKECARAWAELAETVQMSTRERSASSARHYSPRP